MDDNCKIAVVGLGVCVDFPWPSILVRSLKRWGLISKKRSLPTARKKKIPQVRVSREEFERAGAVSRPPCDPTLLSHADYIVVAVPTPIDQARRPDLRPVEGGLPHRWPTHEKRGHCYLFESTVYPGVTEELCVPILEKESRVDMEKRFPCGIFPRAHQSRG